VSNYKERFRAEMVKRMLEPNAPPQRQLADETGVPQPTLSRWRRQATTLDAVPSKKGNTHGGKRRGAGRKPAGQPARRPRERTAEEKLQIVLEAAKLSDAELGAFLRDKGVFEIELLEWREMALSGLNREPAVRPATPAEVKRVRELERELRRKDKALAEAAALIVLKKKVRALWGDEDDDTDPTSEE
jgi:transposase-like protein